MNQENILSETPDSTNLFVLPPPPQSLEAQPKPEDNIQSGSLLQPYRYQSGGALSTRMIIEASSYVTTPCDSPPDPSRPCFLPQGDQHKIPSDAGGLAVVDNLLRESCQYQQEEYMDTNDVQVQEQEHEQVQKQTQEPKKQQEREHELEARGNSAGDSSKVKETNRHKVHHPHHTLSK